MTRSLLLTHGWLLIALSAMLAIPSMVAILHPPADVATDVAQRGAFLFSQTITLGVGGILLFFTRGGAPVRITVRAGFMIAASSWIVVGFFASFPYYLSGAIPDLEHALFEAVSGLTTTGASIIPDLTVIPKGVIFWRSLTQWIGGIGIVVLFVAALPLVAEGSHNLFRAEVPGGANFAKVTPRVRETARLLWIVYFFLTGVEVTALAVAGMPLFDAFLHAFTTMPTGGFSPYPGSIGDVKDPAQVWIIIVFMVLAGANLTIYWRLAREGSQAFLQNPEIKGYVLLLVTASIAITASLIVNEDGGYETGEAITHGFFQAISIMTGTGFSSADFNLWNPFAKTMLLMLMFVGGCAGSTTGSVKVARWQILLKAAGAEIRRMADPREVIAPRFAGAPLGEREMRNALVFVVLFIGTFALGALILAAMGVDMVTAFAASIACLGCVGPGLGDVGPAASYAGIPDSGKLLLTGMMIAGRLELFGVLIFVASFFYGRR